MSNNISIDELEKAFALIIARMKTDGYSTISLEMNEYWKVLGQDMGNFDVQPELAVGALDHDLHFLRQSLEEGEIISYTDFDRVAALLEVISNIAAPAE